MVTVQGPVPEHAPDHPPNTKSAPGNGVSVTDDWNGNSTEQVAPQSIPAGLLVTLPFPRMVTVRTG